MAKPKIAKIFNYRTGIALGILLLCLLGCLWLMNPSFNPFRVNLFTPSEFRQVASRLGVAGPFIYMGLIALSGLSVLFLAHRWS